MSKVLSPSDVSRLVEDQGIKLVDFKFCDLLGTWQHFTTTLNEYSEAIFEDGLGPRGGLGRE
jgi:glutamine synthetase